MEIQDDHKIPTETKISNGPQDELDELNLFGHSQKAQTMTEDITDQKELYQLGSEGDLQKLADEAYTQNEKPGVTTDNDSASDDELPCDHAIFGDVLTKIKAFAEKSKQEKVEKNILIDEWRIFNELFNLMEKHQTNLTDEDVLIVEKGLKSFLSATRNVDLDDLFTIDSSYTKKDIFYTYFNLFNISIIQNYFKHIPMPDHFQMIYRLCVSRILDVMTEMSIYTDLALSDVQRPTNCIELLSLMLNYVQTDLESSDLTLNPSFTDASITREMILELIWNYADKTVLVPDLVEARCPEILIDGLTIICKTADVDDCLQKQILEIIYNISRHDDGVKRLNALNAADKIKAFQSYNENITLNTKCCMALALLSTLEQIKNGGKYINDVLDTLFKMAYDASVSPDHRHHPTLHHLSELLIVFVKLFNDDHTLDYIIEHSQVDLHTSSTIHFFINLLMYYYSKVSNENPFKYRTCTALVNILWSISFQEKYKQQLKNTTTKFKELIRNLTQKTGEKVPPNQYVPQYIENIQKAAKGFLFNIDELTHSTSEQISDRSTISDHNQKAMIMISYSHEDIEFCKQLYHQVFKKGYDVWIDFQFLKTGDLWEQIAIAMKRASVILCLMSEDYCKSKSCRWEATYALDILQTTKSVIPLVLQKHQLPDWLEIRTTGLKYVRFHDLKQLEDDKLSELVDMIEHSLPPIESQTKHSRIFPIHEQLVSIPLTKDNKPALHSKNVLPIHHDKPTQTKSTVTKIENEEISSVLRTTTSPNLYSEKSVEQWDKNDISQWFEHNQILPELRDLCHFQDGYELLPYIKIFLDTEKLQYHIYSEEFSRHDGITSGQRPLLLHQFTKFSNALRKLQKLIKSA